MIELCASVLAANHAHIARDLKAAERSGIRRFHFDICDGHYTRHLIFGDQLIRDVRPESTAFFDAHLAVYNMRSILETFLPSGADMINLQYESCEGHQELIGLIRDHGLKVSMCFTPETGAGEIIPFLEMVDAVNILAVNPGIGGQQFQGRVLSKIEQLARFIGQHGLETDISVDGGVNAGTLKDVMNAGATIAIVGSGIFSGDIEENIEGLQRIIN